MSNSDLTRVRAPLLEWYQDNARDLPWRRTTDPYAIWVSEIMLQQTRVETVIPYYERFLERFPTLSALASAEEDEVLALWSGLGYYRRARLLHRGVKEVIASYGGEVPAGPDERLGLPGIGRYTAGAIGSIAFSKEEAIVDGNVARVLARVHRIKTPLGTRETELELWHQAESLVRGERPGDLNQALMELGATVCTPAQPKCLLCPIREACQAHEHGEIDALPVPRERKAPKGVRLIAVVPMRGRGAKREVWLQRGGEQLFGGMWSAPATPFSRERAPRATALALLREIGLRAEVERDPLGEVRHVLTHRRLHLEVYRAKSARAREGAEGRFFKRAELDSVGVPKLTTKVLDLAFAAIRARSTASACDFVRPTRGA